MKTLVKILCLCLFCFSCERKTIEVSKSYDFSKVLIVNGNYYYSNNPDLLVTDKVSGNGNILIDDYDVEISGFIEGNIINGSKEGIWTCIDRFYSYKIMYKNNKINGELLQYYDDGQLSQKCNFNDGLRQGDCFTYHDNGQLMSKKYYVKGVLIKYTEYDEKGKIIGNKEY